MSNRSDNPTPAAPDREPEWGDEYRAAIRDDNPDLEPVDQDALLDRAEAERWSTRELRGAVRELRAVVRETCRCPTCGRARPCPDATTPPEGGEVATFSTPARKNGRRSRT
jgi:hypothetical protein